MRCELSPEAIAVLQVIGDYIARDNPQRAARFVAKLLAHTQWIAERPVAYPVRTEFREDLSLCVFQKLP